MSRVFRVCHLSVETVHQILVIAVILSTGVEPPEPIGTILGTVPRDRLEAAKSARHSPTYQTYQNYHGFRGGLRGATEPGEQSEWVYDHHHLCRVPVEASCERIGTCFRGLGVYGAASCPSFPI